MEFQNGRNVVGFQYDITVSLCLQERKCCEGYYGINCEKCPGSEGQPCFGNGVCVDGINGTGVCQCNQGFNGTACESCQAGKYGIHCDQGIRDLKAYTAYSVNSYLIQYALSFCLECKCVNGRCKDNVDGDGSCDCDLGWRGINCATGMILTCCSIHWLNVFGCLTIVYKYIANKN